MLTYISNTDHYKDVLSRVQSVKHMLWIGTADIKDLYIEMGKEKKPFFGAHRFTHSAGSGGATHSCEGAGTELPRGFRQVPSTV